MIEAVRKRRSVRTFTDQPVEPEKLEQILRAGMQAPSAHNTQPWEFLVVTDEADKKAVSEMSPYAKMAAKAPMLIIVCGNRERGLEDGEGYSWWPEDLAACTENMLLQIAEEGLGGVWLGFYPKKDRVQKVKDHFCLPDHIVPFSVVVLGHGVTDYSGTDRFDPAKIHYGRF